jgi:predicted kinase
MVGLPASGKSRYLEQLPVSAISSDHIRWLLMDDPADQSIHGAVFATVRYLLRRRMQLGRPVTYIDATNVTLKERRTYIKFGELWGARVEALWFDTPVEVCKALNRKRSRMVPEEAIDAMAAKFQVPTVEEGFASVTRVEFVFAGEGS